MRNNEKLPILSYHTGEGWTTHGFASSESAAKRCILKIVSDDSISLIRKYGFQLFVSERSELSRELNGGPKGYVWSIGKMCGKQ